MGQPRRAPQYALLALGITGGLATIALLVVLLVAWQRLPTHPACVDPKQWLQSAVGRHRAVRLKVVGSTATPSAVGQYLTLQPGSKLAHRGHLTLRALRRGDRHQWFTFSRVIVNDTQLLTLQGVAGSRPWQLVSPCAMRSMEGRCALPGADCPLTMTQHHDFSGALPCAGATKDATHQRAVATTPFPRFTFAHRDAHSPCGFLMQHTDANQLRGLSGWRVVSGTSPPQIGWGTPDLIVAFVSVPDVEL